MSSLLPVPFPYVWTTDRDAQAAFNRARALGGDANVRMIQATTRLLKGAGVWGMVQGLWLPGEVCTLDGAGKSGNLLGLRGAGGVWRDALQPVGSLQQTRVMDPLLGPAVQFGTGWYDAEVVIPQPGSLVSVTYADSLPSSHVIFSASKADTAFGWGMQAPSGRGWAIEHLAAGSTAFNSSGVVATGARATLTRTNGANSAIRVGDTITVGSIGSGGMDGVRLGASRSSFSFWPGRIALAMVIAGDIGPLDGTLANRLMQALYTLYPATRP